MGVLYYELDQMFGYNFGQDAADEFDNASEAASDWVGQCLPATCVRLLEEIAHLMSTTTDAGDRRRALPRQIMFVADDGSDLDPLLAEVGRLLRERIAHES